MSSPSQLNFLPEDYLDRKRQQRTNILCLVLFAAVMAGLIGAFVSKEKREAAANQEQSAVNRRLEAAGEQIAQTEQMAARKEKMIHKAEVTAQLLERRPRHYLLALLTNMLPKGASLLAIELSTREIASAKTAGPAGDPAKARASRAATGQSAAPKVDQPGPPTRVETLRVTGLAPDDKVVSRYIGALDGSMLFRKVELLFSEEHVHQQHPVRRFMLQLELDDQAAVTDEMISSVKLRPDAVE